MRTGVPANSDDKLETNLLKFSNSTKQRSDISFSEAQQGKKN
jgi:hypothetical protein